MSKEKTIFVVYEKILRKTETPLYVGQGTPARANEGHREDEDFNKMVDSGLVETRIVAENLTEGESKHQETLLIQKYGIENLYNRTKGTTGYEDENYDTEYVNKVIEKYFIR